MEDGPQILAWERVKRRAPEQKVDQLVPQERMQIRRDAVSKGKKFVPQERVQLRTSVEVPTCLWVLR